MLIKPRILLLTSIPVYRRGNHFFSLDLWTRDLVKQADVATVYLVCPIDQKQNESRTRMLDPRIPVYDIACLDDKTLSAVVASVDIVQIPGNFGWSGSSEARRFMKAARRAGKVVVLGVSSNRARTVWLNSSGKNLVSRVLAIARYVDIRVTQSWLALRADGVFVVGEGVAKLFAHLTSNLHVGVASWITASDVVETKEYRPIQPLRLCMASRIERMKGMHLGVAAISQARKQNLAVELTIFGDGPALTELKTQISDAGLSPISTFAGTVPYPHPFLDLLGMQDILLLTNLNDEQPRVVFDAMARCCLPLCPDTPSYRGLGLDERLFYRHGNANDLADAISRISNPETINDLRIRLPTAARAFTIDAMHARRIDWIKRLLLFSRSPAT